MKRKWTQIGGVDVRAALLAVLLVAAFCPAAAVISTEPADGATGVARGTNILVNFDQEMDATSLNADTVLVNGTPLDKIKEGAVLLPDPQGKQAVILMHMNLDTVYEITLSPKIRDARGEELGKAFSWRFITASNVDAPNRPVADFARYPRRHDRDIPTNAPITVMFRTELDAATVTNETFIVRDNVTEKPIAGSITVAGDRVVFRPDALLAPNMTYEVVLRAGIKSTAGLTKQYDSSWEFTTGQGPATGPIVTDAWFEMYSDSTRRWAVLHAAVENLVKPGDEEKSGIEPANRSVLAKGHVLNATIVPLKGLLPVSEPSPIAPVDNKETQAAAVSAAPDAPIVAAYNHPGSGGQGIGNSIGTPKDPEIEKLRGAARTAVAKGGAVSLKDTGDQIADGDRAKGDQGYSARLDISSDVPEGPAVATFSIALPDGTQTEPVMIPLYIQPPPQ